MSSAENLSNRVVIGAIWCIAMRWGIRLIGLISVIILARLLAPEDFGLVAMATIISGIANVLFEFGVNVALIRDADADERDYNTAWTIRIIQATVAALFLVAIAPLAVVYFNEPRLEIILWITALGLLVGGFENIGTVLFQKNLDFGKDFQFEVVTKLARFTVTVTLAVILRSYWAMIIGILVGNVLRVLLSYYFHAYRPRFELSQWRKIWHFAQWFVLQRIGIHLGMQIDRLIIGGRESTANVGTYFMAAQVTHMISTELLLPIGRALLPNLSALQKDYAALGNLTLMAYSTQVTLLFPLCAGMALVAEEFVPIILGEKWLAVIPLMEVLALYGMIYSVRYAFNHVLVTLNRLQYVTLLVWLELVIFIALVTLAFPQATPLDIAIIKVALSALFCFGPIAYAVQLDLLTWQDCIKHLWRPSFAVAAMAILLTAIDPHLTDIAWVDLFLKAIIGAAIYTSLLYGSWFASGRPQGVETWTLSKIGLHKA